MNEMKPTIRIGRSRDSELRIEDISVSRIHAFIKLTDKGYMLEDNKSKFGTLFLLGPEEHEIPESNGLYLQFSRSTLSLIVKSEETTTQKNTNLQILEFPSRSSIQYLLVVNT